MDEKKTFKQFRDDVRKRKTEKEENEMMKTILRKETMHRQKAERVLAEALLFYYQNRERERWRKV